METVNKHLLEIMLQSMLQVNRPMNKKEQQPYDLEDIKISICAFIFSDLTIRPL